jgi:hypothetical protein
MTSLSPLNSGLIVPQCADEVAIGLICRIDPGRVNCLSMSEMKDSLARQQALVEGVRQQLAQGGTARLRVTSRATKLNSPA